VSWGGEREVNQAELHTLSAAKIHVKDRLGVSDILLHDNIDLEVNRLHITKSDRGYAKLVFHEITRPLNIGILSFDLGTRIEIRKEKDPYRLETGEWKPIRLTGTLDVTNMNIFNTVSVSDWERIGEMIQILILQKMGLWVILAYYVSIGVSLFPDTGVKERIEKKKGSFRLVLVI
jgi:hypothetical protein